MPFKIPGLDTYFGGKGGSGTYQQIINIIPPHKHLLIPFAGNCGVTRNIKPCQRTYVNDLDAVVVDAWLNSEAVKQGCISVNKKDAFEFIEIVFHSFNSYDSVNYWDPPYPKDTRKSNHKYKYELSDQQHLNLLDLAKKNKQHKILISTYDNLMYQHELKGWNNIQFTSQTRKGVAVETVYFNYDMPTELHDYSYLGNDYKEREQYKLKRSRLIDKFNRMTPLERNYYMEALSNINF
tara:strand:- start:9711 stop:10421 length:711 start_codon:yes stop_codon:yes gene_type:complete